MRGAARRLVWIGLVIVGCSDGTGGDAPGASGGGAGRGTGTSGSTGSTGVAGGGEGGGTPGVDAGQSDGGMATDAGETSAGMGGRGGGAGDTGGVGGGDAGPDPQACDDPPCPAPFEILFADEQLPSFYLTIPDGDGVSAPDSWTQLAACGPDDLGLDPPPPECDYQPATFHATYDPDPLDGDDDDVVESAEIPIGIRLKGRASYRPIDDKAPFKVKFTDGQGERFLGLSRLTLNNLVQDASGLRERMAYRVYRDAGVDAPLANNARVYVKRGEAGSYEYYGLYANVQTLDRRFIEHRFGLVGGQVGNLYDTKNTRYFTEFDRSEPREQCGPQPGLQESCFQLETNESVADTSDLTAAIDAVYVEDIEAGAGQFLASASPLIDVDQWLRLAAAQALIADWDSLVGGRNNFKAYHELARDRFIVFPWGTDQTFGLSQATYTPNEHYGLEHQDSNRVRALYFLRCLRDSADCGARYAEILLEVRETFDTEDLLAEVDRAEQQIEAAMLEDTRRPFDEDDFRGSVQHVRHFIEHRDACVGQLLAGEACEMLDCPAGHESGCSIF